MTDRKEPRSSWKPRIHPGMLIVQRDGMVRLAAANVIVAEIVKDANSVYRFRTKNSAGKWREHYSRSAFRNIRDAKKELCKWI